ncbi:hypothetical protein EVAR_86677_1 [Eumeta japonica]|uniref:Integrase zinc-binding domain-containing protein n=1 Tax=Eumeta variegata TaxID=151549 RepID=A0A4C1XVC1_EUMVA|nr:hypothetical protein EVAR_86677_1 [Eumeta japonica]
MSVFDPLGLPRPSSSRANACSRTWRSGIDWDETIEADAHKKWLKWVNDEEAGIDQNTSMHIARPHRGELHVFVDASEKSYAAAVYWRKIERTRKRSFANSRKSSRRSLKVISISARNCGDSSIAKLIMKHYHERFNHGNHNTVMNEIRQKYYITSLRSKLRKIAHECQWCRINRSLPKMPSAEGDLPPERLRHHHHQPLHVRGRLFRPMSVTIGRRHEKRYALFTCLTTRAVHIELAESLSSDSMILALRRFIARRGTESDVFGQRHEFRRRKQRTDEHTRGTREDEERSRRPHHNLKFIPPGAPNMGGAWERLRSIKTAPLTEVDVEPAEAEGLTPNHFLIGRSCGAAAAGHFDDNVLHGPANWRTCSASPITSGRELRRPTRVLTTSSCGGRRDDGVLRRPTSKIVVLVSAEATAVPCPEV